MEIFVDEFPKTCWGCPCCDRENGACQMNNHRVLDNYRLSDCPLRSLSEYESRVTKSICNATVHFVVGKDRGDV